MGFKKYGILLLSALQMFCLVMGFLDGTEIQKQGVDPGPVYRIFE